MRGMNFIDISYMRVKSINFKEQRLAYRRIKTSRGAGSKIMDMSIPEKAGEILEYYLKEKQISDLIFPILEDVIHSDNAELIFNTYKSRRANHNRILRTISKDLGLEKKLTTYVARHTFATAGLYKGVSKAKLGDMLGHESYYTTEAYFSSFNKKELDEAANSIFE